MNAAGEFAFRKLVAEIPAVAALAGDRVTWDEEDIDIEYPAVTFRTMTAPRIGKLAGNSSLSNPLVEVSCHGKTSGEASRLMDAVEDGLEPYALRTLVNVTELSPAVLVVFSCIRVNDVQNSPSPRERSYRKVAFVSIWQKE